METNWAVPIHESFEYSGPATQSAEIAGKFSEDFNAKLKVFSQNEETQDEGRTQKEEGEGEGEEDVRCLPEEIDEDNHDADDDGDEEEEEDEDEEFSFVSVNPEGALISAEDIFQNGQIRPIFPLFNQDLLLSDGEGDAKGKRTAILRPPVKKLFVEESSASLSSSSSSSMISKSSDPQGPYCAWSGKVVEASRPAVVCKKSNSTGFSKLWRFRELVLRSNSDGKDAFVFLNPSTAPSTKTSSRSKKAEKSEKSDTEKKKGKGEETTSSAHEKHYVRNRAVKEGGKRKSFLPYKHVGFFADVNGMSKNVHPY